MNRRSQNDWCAKLARDYAANVDTPAFDLKAIERRVTLRESVRPSWPQYAFAAAVLLGLVAWAAPAMPALIAEVQNVMQLFLERNGQMVPATNRVVTIDEAARTLSFKVIPPSGVPLAIAPTIQEITVPNDPQSAQLLVQYASNAPGPHPGFTALPALTIVETAASAPSANLMFTVHPVNAAPMAPPKSGRPPGSVRVQALSLTWSSGGTRITLLGTPGAITQAQLESIRRAMGGP